jgi:hypothetical protein
METERIPFDLKKARTGKYKIVTRDGVRVIVLRRFKRNRLPRKLVGILEDGDSVGWFEDGKFDNVEDCFYDLFLIKK